MIEHSSSCGIHKTLLSDPPQPGVCDCGGVQNTTAQVVNIFDRGSVRKSGGSPPATATTAPGTEPGEDPIVDMITELRDLADRLEKGEVPYVQMIVIPVDMIGTHTPYVFGRDIGNAELVGRLDICKQLIFNEMWDENA